VLDWRNPADYEYTAELTPRLWAWEFLRRHPVYQKAWREFQAAKSALEAAGAEPDEETRLRFNKAAQLAYRPFGLVEPADPELSVEDLYQQGKKVGFHVLGGLRIVDMVAIQGPPGDPWPGYPEFVCLRFDFTRPLNRQIELAREYLRGCERILRERGRLRVHRPTVRPRPDQFTLYLRLLDAWRAGATFGQMGQALFPAARDKAGSAEGALETAKALVNGGYAEILELPVSAFLPSRRKKRRG